MLLDWRESGKIPRVVQGGSDHYGNRSQAISACVVHNTGGDEDITQDNRYHEYEAHWYPDHPAILGGAPHIAYHFWAPYDPAAFLAVHGIPVATQPTPAVLVWCNHLIERSWHATGGNDEAVGVACQVDGQERGLSEAQKTAVLWLMDKHLPANGVTIPRSRVFGHGECPAVYGGGPGWGNVTVCPGEYALPWVKELRQGLHRYA